MVNGKRNFEFTVNLWNVHQINEHYAFRVPNHLKAQFKSLHQNQIQFELQQIGILGILLRVRLPHTTTQSAAQRAKSFVANFCLF